MKIAALILTIIEMVESGKILGFFVVPSISHQYVYRTLMYELSKRGHQVVIVTPNPIGGKHENYTEIDTSEFSYKAWREKFDFTSGDWRVPEVTLYHFHYFFMDLVDKQLSYQPVRSALNQNQFDLIFIEYLIFPCIAGLSHKYKAPFIGITSLDILVPGHLSIANPINPSYFPEAFLHHSDRKSFMERLRTTWLFVFWFFLNEFLVLPGNDRISKKHFGSDTPYIGDIEKNVSLLMSNTDFVIGYPRPHVPAFVTIGGGNAIHFRKNVTLPKVRFCKIYRKKLQKSGHKVNSVSCGSFTIILFRALQKILRVNLH